MLKFYDFFCFTFLGNCGFTKVKKRHHKIHCACLNILIKHNTKPKNQLLYFLKYEILRISTRLSHFYYT